MRSEQTIRFCGFKFATSVMLKVATRMGLERNFVAASRLIIIHVALEIFY